MRSAPIYSFAFAAALVTGLAASAVRSIAPDVPQTAEALGRALFFDVNLSRNRTQSCATCHDPEYGFADPRGAASIGDDGASVGDRNAPTATYAAYIPWSRNASVANTASMPPAAPSR